MPKLLCVTVALSLLLFSQVGLAAQSSTVVLSRQDFQTLTQEVQFLKEQLVALRLQSQLQESQSADKLNRSFLLEQRMQTLETELSTVSASLTGALTSLATSDSQLLISQQENERLLILYERAKTSLVSVKDQLDELKRSYKEQIKRLQNENTILWIGVGVLSASTITFGIISLMRR